MARFDFLFKSLCLHFSSFELLLTVSLLLQFLRISTIFDITYTQGKYWLLIVFLAFNRYDRNLCGHHNRALKCTC